MGVVGFEPGYCCDLVMVLSYSIKHFSISTFELAKVLLMYLIAVIDRRHAKVYFYDCGV